MSASLPLTSGRTLADVARAGGLARAAAWLDVHAMDVGLLMWAPQRARPTAPTELLHTPGVRAAWASLHDWVSVWRELVRRPPTSGKYLRMEAHLVTLAEHPDVVHRAPAEVRGMLARIVREQTPPHGRRASHPTTLLKDALDRARFA